jgi:hypothetical protein
MLYEKSNHLTDQTNQANLVNMANVKEAALDESRGTARVQVIQEAVHGVPDDWRLCFQWCRYILSNGEMEEGYRFIWRRSDGSLQAARGQARIPSIKVARELMKAAEAAGWGKHEGEGA